MADYLLIFDGDCAFCTRCVEWGAKNLKPWVDTKASSQLNPADFGLTQDDFHKSIWLVQTNNPKSTPLGANRAAAKILQQQKNPFWRALGIVLDIWWIRPIARAGYYLVARNRAKMPGGTAACEVPRE